MTAPRTRRTGSRVGEDLGPLVMLVAFALAIAAMLTTMALGALWLSAIIGVAVVAVQFREIARA